MGGSHSVREYFYHFYAERKKKVGEPHAYKGIKSTQHYKLQINNLMGTSLPQHIVEINFSEF